MKRDAIAWVMILVARRTLSTRVRRCALRLLMLGWVGVALSLVPMTAEGRVTANDREILAELNSYIDSTLSLLRPCSAGIVVSRDNEVLFEHYLPGREAQEPKNPINEDALWPLASCTKSYVAALLLSLVSDGVLSLDDAVGDYLPEFKEHGEGPFPRSQVTIRHLASHTSGLTHPVVDGEPDRLVVLVETEPGQVFRYSWLGMHILERMIEAATNQGFEEVLRQHVLDPLSLSETRYVYDYDPALPLLACKAGDFDDLREHFLFVRKGSLASHGLYTTTRELNAYSRLWLDDHQTVFDPALRAEAWRHHGTRSSDNGDYGLLWWLFEEHGGYVISGATHTLSAVVPSAGVVITVTRNYFGQVPEGFNFYEDKKRLVVFGNRLRSEAEWPSFMTASGLAVPDSVLAALRYALFNEDVDAYGSLLDEEYIFRDPTIDHSCGKKEDLAQVAVVFRDLKIRTFEVHRVGRWTEYGSNMEPPVGARTSDEHPDENWEIFSHSTTCYMSREGEPIVSEMPMDSELKLRKDRDTGFWRIVRWTMLPKQPLEPRTSTTEHEERPSARVVSEVHGVEEVKLPQPNTEGVVSVEEALSTRRSIREYSDQALSLQEVGQILWAAQGITSPRGFRTAPSAGGRYPIELYVVVSNVTGLAPGVYHYDSEAHILRWLIRGDVSRPLYDAAVSQPPVLRGAINLLITAVYERTKAKYPDVGEQCVHIEVGCVVQNVYLQTQAIGLGTVVIGAFSPDKVKELLRIEEEPLAIMPIGKR